MKDKIYRISLGIRHRRSFRLPEISGSIMDYIVYDSSSPFEKGFFQSTDALIDNLENKGRILTAKDSSSIVVDTDSFILNLESKDFDKDLKRMKEEMVPFIKKVFKEFDIKNINRVGMVFEFIDPDQTFVNAITGKITDNNYKNTDRFALRFSEKDTDIQSVIKKEILDYANKIVAITQTDEGTHVKFDYQFYYSPEIGSINDVDFEKFIETATDRLNSKVLNWYKKDEKQG